MTQVESKHNGTITAIYENGVLRPLTPLTLPEHTHVQIQVRRVLKPTDVPEHRRRVSEALVVAGLSLPTSDIPSVSSPISTERREELARLFATGRPLSELIIEEREGR
jgi:predicted DNA-binding antitoxin AbrB/MazE fold protein